MTTSSARVTRLGAMVLVFILSMCALSRSLEGQSGTAVVIEGVVTRGVSFAQSFGQGFTFTLKEVGGAWAIGMTHAKSGDKDLIYPVNPPYRFSNRQYIGPGYGESARASANITTRELAFLAQPDDVGRAWQDLDYVLWPYTYDEADVQRATNELAHFPTGTLRFEIFGVDFASCGDRGQQLDECVSGVKFRATVTWPPNP
jgi:hypothetical protein